MVRIVPIAEVDPALVETLLDHAFGKDRRERTAYRVRAGTQAIPELSFAAISGENLAGTIQCWPVRLAADSGEVIPLVMVGPVAVEPALQQGGIGRVLMRRALEAAETANHADRLVLIGDPEYYGRFFDFSPEATAGWRLPGPVERHRLLARGAGVPACAGVLGPQVAERA